MKKNIFLIVVLLNCLSLSKAQSLNWFVSAHAGAGSLKSASMNGAFLAGFRNSTGQQVSVGPVFKNFMVNGIMKNQVAGRIYSQMNLIGIVDAYIQCDLSAADPMPNTTTRIPARLETGMGLNIMIKENLGIGCGYTLGEFNPITNQRSNTPVLKLVFSMPFSSGNRW